MSESESRKITVTYDELIQLAARALSLRYDLTQPFFRSNAQIAMSDNSAELKSVEFEFYGTRQENPDDSKDREK